MITIKEGKFLRGEWILNKVLSIMRSILGSGVFYRDPKTMVEDGLINNSAKVIDNSVLEWILF